MKCLLQLNEGSNGLRSPAENLDFITNQRCQGSDNQAEVPDDPLTDVSTPGLLESGLYPWPPFQVE